MYSVSWHGTKKCVILKRIFTWISTCVLPSVRPSVTLIVYRRILLRFTGPLIAQYRNLFRKRQCNKSRIRHNSAIQVNASTIKRRGWRSELATNTTAKLWWRQFRLTWRKRVLKSAAKLTTSDIPREVSDTSDENQTRLQNLDISSILLSIAVTIRCETGFINIYYS